ncbi:hypothetical protein [Pantoea stewartii]|uniref:hypothetical protein n=1 Tax=Pantoea stewartii TaxID=66269 RepID=UPI0025A2E631|nr:hypothetical protein [Pantoea stewartii]
MLRMVSQTWLTIVLVIALIAERSHSVVARVSRYSTIATVGAEEHAGYAVRAEQRRAALDACGDQRRAAAW